MTMRLILLVLASILVSSSPAHTETADGRQKLVFIAGKHTHSPGEHEFGAGAELLAKCLAEGAPDLHVEVVLDGWPEDEKVFEGADAIVFYMDGGPKHEIVQEGGERISKIEEWVKEGIGIGCMHYGVEVEATKAGAEFKRWIGGYYEHAFSCNPMWEPNFKKLPKHPITQGVRPFQLRDDWYMNIRFADGFSAEETKEDEGTKFTPILVATPSDDVRDGPYAWPKGPYEHVVAASGLSEAMMWAVDRPDGGRGFGFTGGHFHRNWINDDYRKTILNALVWVSKAKVPEKGIVSKVTVEDIAEYRDYRDPKEGE